MSVTEAEADALIQIVRDVARSEILPRFRSLDAADIASKSAADDLITVADTAAEAAMTAAFAKAFADARIIGEEAISADKSLLDQVTAPGRTIVIDPIDGTWNFANGLANFGVLIAVIEDGETVFGLLYDVVGDDWIQAHKGQGAWYHRPERDPARLSVSDHQGPLADMFGYIGIYLFHTAAQVNLAATLPKFRRTMTLRCSCHEYRQIVQGRAEFVLNGMLNVWDHAAGVLCLQEAGGVARLLDGRDYSPDMREGYMLTAASEAIWKDLAALWQDAVMT